MESWILGVILVLVGVLVLTCGFKEVEYCVFFRAIGAGLASVGFLTFVVKFWKWIQSI
ncbi:MAG: hypothetical protein NWF05_05650 [Candidatus Bathyarchaeota archaeon]|nr:hypothetical protein [Candidatus Bathyarchaeota archaeon]